jgi:hypothetical protein
MILCDAGRALALGSVPMAFALGNLTMVQLYTVSLLEGSLFVFFNLAEVACLPRVITKEQLPAAAARIMGTMSTAALIGPALGGLLFSLGSFLPFVVDAISYVASTVSLLFIS